MPSTLSTIPTHLVLGAVDLVVSRVEAHTLAAPALSLGWFFKARRHRGESANETHLNPMAAASTSGAWITRTSIRACGDEVVGGLANEAALDSLLALAVKARHLAWTSDARDEWCGVGREAWTCWFGKEFSILVGDEWDGARVLQSLPNACHVHVQIELIAGGLRL